MRAAEETDGEATFGTELELHAGVRKLCTFLLLVVAGCSRDAEVATATIPPAEPRPAPTMTSTVPDGHMVTTSGSPPPVPRPAPGTQFVTVSATGIEMRELLPLGHTAFLVTNETALAHHLVLRSASGTEAAAVAPKGEAMLQRVLSDPEYELVCTTPGHSERTQFKTYTPGPPALR